MAQNQYDPYGSEQDLSYGSMIKEAATSPIKPSSYLGLYTTLPTMWSTSKGVHVPFVGKHLSRGGGAAVLNRMKRVIGVASKRGFAGWAGLASKSALGVATMGWSSKGSGKAFGVASLEKQISKLESNVAMNYRKLDKYWKLEDKLKNMSKNQTAHVRSMWNQGGYIGDELGFKGARLKQRTLRSQSKAVSGIVEKYGDNLVNKIGAAEGTLKNLRMWKNVGKWGLRAGKAVSVIGGAMLAWDLISMVAEPTGRALVRGLDNVMTQYQQRFMPDLGGKLQLSYLSQGAATERQRAIQSISKSYINGRSAFGSEAQYMHQ